MREWKPRACSAEFDQGGKMLRPTEAPLAFSLYRDCRESACRPAVSTMTTVAARAREPNGHLRLSRLAMSAERESPSLFGRFLRSAAVWVLRDLRGEAQLMVTGSRRGGREPDHRSTSSFQ